MWTVHMFLNQDKLGRKILYLVLEREKTLEKDFLYKFIGFKYRFRIYASWRQVNTEIMLCVWLGLIWAVMKKVIESNLLLKG